MRAKDGLWTVYRCVYQKEVRFVLTIAYTEEGSIYNMWQEDVLGFVGKKIGSAHLSYLDSTLIGTGESYRGVVPCRSIWDASGGRLSAVLFI